MTSIVKKTNCDTRTENEQYDLISVLYHGLESTVTYEQYIKDAQKAEDQELVIFFQELKEANCHAAEKAKRLLKQRLN